jgi:SET domain-containing protein
MIVVAHYVATSAIAGAGLFTAEAIAKGTVVYRENARFLQVIADTEIAALPPAAREALRKYSYRGKGRWRLTDAVYFCADDSRFMNHADAPNLVPVDDGEVYIAACDIAAHTELTCDYAAFSELADCCFDFEPPAA